MYEIYAYCPHKHPSYNDACARGDSYSNVTDNAEHLAFMEKDIRSALASTRICVIVIKDGEFLDATLLP
jgi:hypothetical protein